MNEVDKFVSDAQDIEALPSDSENDELAVRMSYPLLEFFHFAYFLDILKQQSVPHLKETLESISKLTHGHKDQEDQFYDAMYEVVSAGDFASFGLRPSFIETSQISRYNKRVEYLIKHKWPVECKRPRKEDNIRRLALDACEKIDERGQNGIVCITLERALSNSRDFKEYLNLEELLKAAEKPFLEYLKDNKDSLISDVLSGNVKAILFHHRLLGYNHEEQVTEAPLLRCALLKDGTIVSNNVFATISELLSENDEPKI